MPYRNHGNGEKLNPECNCHSNSRAKSTMQGRQCDRPVRAPSWS